MYLDGCGGLGGGHWGRVMRRGWPPRATAAVWKMPVSSAVRGRQKKWSASVFSRNRESAQLQLSPGDLDEAVSALLSTAEHREGSGSGAERVAAYRDGFMDGADACLR